jgi:hypothetical protein
VGVVLEINGFSYYVPLMDERKGVYFDIDYMTDEQVAVISQLIDIFRTTNMGAGSMRSLNKQNKELIDKQKTEIK